MLLFPYITMSKGKPDYQKHDVSDLIHILRLWFSKAIMFYMDAYQAILRAQVTLNHNVKKPLWLSPFLRIRMYYSLRKKIKIR